MHFYVFNSKIINILFLVLLENGIQILSLGMTYFVKLDHSYTSYLTSVRSNLWKLTRLDSSTIDVVHSLDNDQTTLSYVFTFLTVFATLQLKPRVRTHIWNLSYFYHLFSFNCNHFAHTSFHRWSNNFIWCFMTQESDISKLLLEDGWIAFCLW